MDYKYKSLKDFKIDNPKEYKLLSRNKLLGKLCLDMGWVYKERKTINLRVNNWTKELCHEEALKHTSRKEWRSNCYGSYQFAYRNGFIAECCSHMEKRLFKFWFVKENCILEALKYETITEWAKSSSASYGNARKNNWLDDCTAHMIKKQLPNGYWTKQRCAEDALNYETKYEWQKKSSSAYNTALKNDWMDECSGHMVTQKVPKSFWTKERCLNEALKYDTRTDWRSGSMNSYRVAKKNGWFDECVKHMGPVVKYKGFWVKELCIEEAVKYKTKNEWKKNSIGSYESARRNGWFDECVKHMK
jgi:hypothetical protein